MSYFGGSGMTHSENKALFCMMGPHMLMVNLTLGMLLTRFAKFVHSIYVRITTTTITNILWPLYRSRSTCVSRHLQLRTGGFCWCKVLLPACPC